MSTEHLHSMPYRAPPLPSPRAPGLWSRTDLFPVYAFSLVFLLLLFEHELDEQLLQLLVTVVDAQLLKTVAVEHLEAVYVQHADHGALAVQLAVPNLDRVVDPADDPRKQAIVNGLQTQK